MTLPNLFLAGFAKCGTTFLHSILVQHESILGYKFKETNMFNMFNDDDQIKSFADKYMLSDCNERYRVDSTVTYIENIEALDKINLICHNPKFIIGIRNLSDATISTYAQYVYKFGKKEIEKKITERMRKCIAEDDRYYLKIKRLVDLVGEENVFIYDFKHLKDRTKLDKLIKKIQVFLDIKVNPKFDEKKIKKNESVQIRFKVLSRIINIRGINRFLMKVFNPSVIEKLQQIKKQIEAFNKTILKVKYNVDDDLKKEVDLLYQREIKKIKSIKNLNFYA
tara:strand:- start:682 stop:1521 length:840 start_codon:yes stop_codon:yes gene_type:complete